jgi:hypothetical protein
VCTWAKSPDSEFYVRDIVYTALVRVVVESAEKVVFLFLVVHFGSRVQVKTFVHSNGDLIVVGEDFNNRTVF